jgi:hypothetical protein
MCSDTIKNDDIVGGNFSSSYYTQSIDTKHEEIFPLTTQNISIEEGLDFLTHHFEEPIWPRAIFTKTLAKQITVFSREETLARFKQSNLLDCRVNAYPDYISYCGINRQPPNFIDIDRLLFTTDQEFWSVVEQTRKNIEQSLGGRPSVLWSGNGIHICQPVEAIVLEQESNFAQFDHPSQTFLRFAAQFLSNHKSDTNNNPAFKSCLLRIPGSYNSKYVEQNRETAEVKVIQRWDGFRPKANPLYYHFYIYLADRKLREFNNMQTNHAESHSFRGSTIPWIEKLLETPIDDYRKNSVNLILAPYLINVKKLSYDAALNIINSWLDKCVEVRQLDQNFDYTVRYALKYSAKNGHKPIKFDTLRMKNKPLYDVLQ